MGVESIKLVNNVVNVFFIIKILVLVKIRNEVRGRLSCYLFF